MSQINNAAQSSPSNKQLYLGKTDFQLEKSNSSGNYVQLDGETFYRIAHYDHMPYFFMSLVSSADHWLFISSSSGLTAGRSNADSALFPYETEDKITAQHELTGPKTIIRATRNDRTYLWIPFSNQYQGIYRYERHLYKNVPGNKLVFEEINLDLGLAYRLAWRTSDQYGFVTTSWLQNDGESCEIDILTGLQNVLPYGATAQLQTTFSSLLHAYKRNELDSETGLGLFTLSATLTDQAEPSESLKATVVWQVGLDQPTHLLCAQQMPAFINGRILTQEEDICGKAGTYLLNTSFTLPANETKQWHIIADVNYDSTAVTALRQFLRQTPSQIINQVEEDIELGTNNLLRIVGSADGLQISAEETTTAHHFANVLFNVMRGGIFANGYQIDKADFLAFVKGRNHQVLGNESAWIETLPAQMTISELYEHAAKTNNPDLIRFSYEYLPLMFSRRHGDPSRPWNQFSINLKQADGSPKLDYQGNWRDIFQNWEPLAFAFPDYAVALIAKFLNATTADGYNPYRVTREGIEWEVPEPDNPWANIGYWSDHQIIYLQKLLEAAEQLKPGILPQLWQQPVFAYANVPYRLKPYREMLINWYDTIDFDWESEKVVETAVSQIGSDGRLLHDRNDDILHVTMVEKLLVLLLAKLTNLVPDGGIWMNTQRPEWNDANNALVGKGLSVVTAAYVRRFIVFWLSQLEKQAGESYEINETVADLFAQVNEIFNSHQAQLTTGFNDQTRRAIFDALGQAATTYRTSLYQNGLATNTTSLDIQTLQTFLNTAQQYIDHTLRANKRDDGLYHAYNILRLDDEQSAAVDYLYPMLEGQVAILSTGLLASEEVLALLKAMRASDLYRPDQHSYMLYPNRTLPGFLQKNNVSAQQVADSALVKALTEANDRRLIMQDKENVFHFNGRFRNAGDAARVLDELAQEPAYTELVNAERTLILDLFEGTFNHRAFTGRSGTFFAYEGLGSIYWHMVSKLLLAVQENYQKALAEGADTAVLANLITAYYDVRQGLSFNKTPAAYGAFPTDPYSHTPIGRGAQQPGMTGQVKEEILTRWGELGVAIVDGVLTFTPTMLRDQEYLAEATTFNYVDVTGQTQTLSLPPNALAFTFCQTPIVYTKGEAKQIKITTKDGELRIIDGNHLDAATTHHIFARDGHVQALHVVV